MPQPKYECNNCERYAIMIKRYPNHNSQTNVCFTCNCRENYKPKIDK